jgi:hypothetical protein
MGRLPAGIERLLLFAEQALALDRVDEDFGVVRAQGA